MENIINFKQAREKIDKSKKDRQAIENRAKFGLKKSIKDLNKQEQEKLSSHLEGHKITEPEDIDKPEA